MVRSRRLLEIIEQDHLIEAAAETGGWFVKELQSLQGRHDNLLSNARGRGLMCAVDLPDPRSRDQVLRALREEEHVLALACGEGSIRFRPALSVSPEELQYGLDALDRCLGDVVRETTP
jgi:L-lysine 6-transaminase